MPLVGIGELKGKLTSNKWLRSSSRVSPTTAARPLPIRVSPSPCRGGQPFRRGRPGGGRGTPRLKNRWTRDTETSATPPSPPFTRGTKTGNPVSRAHSRRKFAEDRATAKLCSLNSRGGGNTGHRQLTQPKTAWRRHWTENFASGSRSNSGRQGVSPWYATRINPARWYIASSASALWRTEYSKWPGVGAARTGGTARRSGSSSPSRA